MLVWLCHVESNIGVQLVWKHKKKWRSCGKWEDSKQEFTLRCILKETLLIVEGEGVIKPEE